MANEFVLREWVERVGKTVYGICNDPARNRIKLNEQHTGFIMESSDSIALSSIGQAIEKHLNEIPSTNANISKYSRGYQNQERQFGKIVKTDLFL